MSLIKTLLPTHTHHKRSQKAAAAAAAITRLFRKLKHEKAQVPAPKTLHLGFVLEHFMDPVLPMIVLRPPTPTWDKYDVEERLFEREGAMFKLRKEEDTPVGELRVPKCRAVRVCQSLPEMGGKDVKLEDGENGGGGELDAECVKEYCAYMAGMDRI
jgi:hypothetical protein